MAPKRKGQGTQGGTKKAKVVQHSPEEFNEFYETVLELIHELMDEANERQIVGAFIKLPSKKFYGDYYRIIKSPICITDMQRKLARGDYPTDSVDEFVGDFRRLLDNASAYNDPESWIVEDATKLYEYVELQAAQFNNGTWNLLITVETLPQDVEQLLTEVIDHEFPEIGVISGPFLEDIDKKEYPDYFKIIKNPTSFKKVLNQLDGKLIKQNDSMQSNLDRVQEAINLIFTNAQTYNDPSSLIHQDSLKLQEYFNEKFEELKTKALNDTRKAQEKEAMAAKAKTSKKGRRKATPEPITEPMEGSVHADESNDEEDVGVKEDNEGEDVEMEGSQDEEEVKKEAETPIPTLESNVMGKTDKLGAADEVFIQEASLGSVPSTIPQIVAQTKEFNSYRASQPASRYQLMKDSIFPAERADSISTLFEYKFPANGYCNQSYTLALPSDSSSFVSARFCLHDYLFSLKETDLAEGVGIAGLISNDEFQCKLFVNDDEVETTADVDEEKMSNGRRLLKLQYDLKLSYGLNILTFECKVAPSVSKIIRKSADNQERENEEVAGRHTRHQIQQMKMSWEVEKFNLFVICNSL